MCDHHTHSITNYELRITAPPAHDGEAPTPDSQLPITNSSPPVIAVCGKGGVGKTVVAALLAKTMIDHQTQPLLLIDADPAGGLISVLGERSIQTLGQVRKRIIAAARRTNDQQKMQLADQIDYLLLAALLEREYYSLLAMGHSEEKGCFCPVNQLLRSAIENLTSQFAAILIDAEAGLEQINRQVIQDITHIVVVVDGSLRSLETLQMIRAMTSLENIHVIANRIDQIPEKFFTSGMIFLGTLPEDPTIRRFDCDGTPLWQLPGDNPVLQALHPISHALSLQSPVRMAT